MKKAFLLLTGLLLFFTSCNKRQDRLEQALQLAGSNRPELEKVLDRYSQDPSDSLKYRAAVFLIKNMVYYHAYEGKALDDYLPIFEGIATSDKEPQAVLDSFIFRYGSFNRSYLNVLPDIEHIGSDYLIRNIEWAFKVWQEQPWGKHVAFADFCEYILPYRIGDEKPDDWRSELYLEFNHLLDPYRDTREIADPLFAARIIIDSLYVGERNFTTYIPDLPHIGYRLCKQWRTGTCRELTDLTIYVLRALGIPCGMDFLPVHARVSADHKWAFILDLNGDTYTSDYLDPDIGILPVNDVKHLTSKIYRQTFSLNEQLVDELTSSAPPFFRHPRMRDVTAQYTNRNPVRSVIVPEQAFYDPPGNSSRPYYLCVSLGMDWVPVAWTKKRNNRIQFDHVKSNIMFRVGIWENEQMIYLTDAIRVTGLNGETVPLVFDEKKREPVILYSKYETGGDEDFGHLMIGGVFEASNHIDFTDPDTLFIVNEIPLRMYNVAYTDPAGKYRYVRYRGPDGSFCDVAEVTFYKNNEDTIGYHGSILGTSNLPETGKNDYKRVFDGDTKTSFHYKESSGGWAGLDLGVPSPISRIVYVPRNRDNYIRKGDEYELFYFNRWWTSMGRKIAEADSLIYDDVPSGILLYLKNHTGGKQERIFTFEKGKQIWW